MPADSALFIGTGEEEQVTREFVDPSFSRSPAYAQTRASSAEVDRRRPISYPPSRDRTSTRRFAAPISADPSDAVSESLSFESRSHDLCQLFWLDTQCSSRHSGRNLRRRRCRSDSSTRSSVPVLFGLSLFSKHATFFRPSSVSQKSWRERLNREQLADFLRAAILRLHVSGLTLGMATRGFSYFADEYRTSGGNVRIIG
jgi:hypothetical protein